MLVLIVANNQASNSNNFDTKLNLKTKTVAEFDIFKSNFRHLIFNSITSLSFQI